MQLCNSDTWSWSWIGQFYLSQIVWTHIHMTAEHKLVDFCSYNLILYTYCDSLTMALTLVLWPPCLQCKSWVTWDHWLCTKATRRRIWDSTLFTDRRILSPPSAFLYTTLSFPTHLSLPFSPAYLLLLVIPLSFSFPISKKPSLSLSLSAITKNGLLAWLSVPVKCNPKSTASSPTTILMVMGSILYQGYHILLEMTVSKVGVDAMGTKTGGRVRVLGGCVRERLCV